MLKESVRDFLMGAQFRRDYWVKGGEKSWQSTGTMPCAGSRSYLTTSRSPQRSVRDRSGDQPYNALRL